MAVTIDEMQLEVKSGAASSQAQQPAAEPPKQTLDLRQEMALLAERKARLQVD